MSDFETPMGSTSDELDFSNDGVQTEEKLWTITSAEVESTENGKRLVVEFETEGANFPQTQRYWLEHENEDAQRIGRAEAKRLATAITGSPRMDPTKIVGQKVLATIKEDKKGFVRLNMFKSAPSAAAAVPAI